MILKTEIFSSFAGRQPAKPAKFSVFMIMFFYKRGIYYIKNRKRQAVMTHQTYQNFHYYKNVFFLQKWNKLYNKTEKGSQL
jgi:hypothetical protein